MAQVQDTTASRHTTRRAPTVHSDAVQEAKRLEKMQAHGSSHGLGSKTPQAAPTKDAAN